MKVMTAHTQLSVRQAEPRDFAAIERIETAADQIFIDTFNPDHWPPAASAADRLAQGGFLLVGEVENRTDNQRETVGFTHVIETAGLAHLEQVSVQPVFGRRGYGRILVEAAMHAARERGHDELTLRTYAELPWNAPFYRSLGFVPSSPRGTFLLGLVEAERAEGLERFGSRVQMTVSLA